MNAPHLKPIASTLNHNPSNKYLSGSGIMVELTGQKQLKSGEFRESIDIVIRNNGIIRTYNQLSAGEKKRIDIAFLFAIADISPVKSNLMVLDEVLDLSLDGSGTEMVMDILIKKSAELDSLIVISHKEELKELFQNVLTVYKENGISYIGGDNGRRGMVPQIGPACSEVAQEDI